MRAPWVLPSSSRSSEKTDRGYGALSVSPARTAERYYWGGLLLRSRYFAEAAVSVKACVWSLPDAMVTVTGEAGLVVAFTPSGATMLSS